MEIDPEKKSDVATDTSETRASSCSLDENEKHDVAVHATNPDAATTTTGSGSGPGSTEQPVLEGPKLYSLLGCLALVILAMALDTTVLATAIPYITDDFKTIRDVGWYPAAYMIGNSAVQPLAGKIFTFSPLTTTYAISVLVFEVGSIVCASAQSSAALVVGRAVAGIGSAGIAVGTMTMIGIAAPKDQRPMLLGLIMSMMAAGQVLGPIIGGALTQHASWRWCFWINLPIGACAMVGVLLLRITNHHRRTDLTIRNFTSHFDIIGFIIFAPACIMLILAFEWAGTTYRWSSSQIIGLLVGSVATFIIFIVWEYRKGNEAMFPRALMARRVVWASSVTGCIQFGALFVVGYYLPLWFQSIKRNSPTISAVHTLPTFLSQVVVSIFAGYLVKVVGYFTPFAMAGNAMTAIGAGLMSTFTTHTGIGMWIGAQFLTGIGRGISMQQPTSAVQIALEPKDLPTGMGIVNWSSFFGGAICIALAQTMFTNILTMQVRDKVPGINPATVIAAGGTDFVHLAQGSTLVDLLNAYDVAVTQVFYLVVGLSSLAVFTSLGMGFKRVLSRKKKDTSKETAEAEPKEDHEVEEKSEIKV